MKPVAILLISTFIWTAILPVSGDELTGSVAFQSDMIGTVLVDPGEKDIDSLYMNANDLYQQGIYEPALEGYHEILVEGFESADLYYNIGNAAYRSNSIGHAILYYEKALKLEPAHDDAIHNLEFVSRYRLDTFDEVPMLFFGSWVKWFVQLFPEKTWSVLALLFFVIILSSLLVFLFSRQNLLKKTGFITGLVALLLFVITVSSAQSRHRDIVNPDAGIILAPSVVVRSSPSESGTELFVLHEGTEIEMKEEISGWQNIKVPDGREGWILSDNFESI